jgi:hypothetical protein
MSRVRVAFAEVEAPSIGPVAISRDVIWSVNQSTSRRVLVAFAEMEAPLATSPVAISRALQWSVQAGGAARRSAGGVC